MAMVDSDGDLSDVRMPAEGTDGHATLLLAEYLAEQAGSGSGIALETLQAKMRQWIEQHRKHWRKSARDAGGEVELCRQAIDCLIGLRLAERTADGVRALPAVARFAVAELSDKTTAAAESVSETMDLSLS
jgi:uncharacterized protein (TIGR02678 family)